MKKLIVALFGLVLATQAHAQGTFLGTNPMVFQTGVTSLTEGMRIDSNQRVLIGGATTTQNNGVFEVRSTDSTGNPVQWNALFSADANPPIIQLHKSRGASVGTYTIVQIGDELGRLSFDGANGTLQKEGARVSAIVTGAPSASVVPTDLLLSTTNASNVMTERVRIDKNGLVNIGNGGASYQVDATSQGLQLSQSGGTNQWGLGLNSWFAGNASYDIAFAHSRSATQGTQTALVANDRLGRIIGYGSDGTNFIRATIISSEVDAAPATNSIPSRIVFSTMGGTTLAEAMRIDSNRHVNYTTTAPTASACAGFAIGTGSSDTAGRVTFTSATSCAISFGTAFTNAPFCTVDPGSAASTVSVTTSTTVLTATFGTANTAMFYHCYGT